MIGAGHEIQGTPFVLDEIDLNKHGLRIDVLSNTYTSKYSEIPNLALICESPKRTNSIPTPAIWKTLHLYGCSGTDLTIFMIPASRTRGRGH